MSHEAPLAHPVTAHEFENETTRGQDDLVRLLKKLAANERGHLQSLKEKSAQFGRHPDWPWNGLVLSAATRGGSWRWAKKVEPRYEDQLSWPVLSHCSPLDRQSRLETVGRFWRRTADWLGSSYTRLVTKGGPAQVREQLDGMSPAEVIAFWRSFDGVGDKYARNIMMDVYHPQFRASYFAIDSRLESLLPLLGYSGDRRYPKREDFLRNMAAEVGIEAWEFDRLLYSKHEELKTVLQRKRLPSGDGDRGDGREACNNVGSCRNDEAPR